MIGVDKIEDIRRRSRGESFAGISRNTGVSEPTVRKCLRMEDLSPSRPGRRIAESELLEPYEATIDAWLLDNCRNWRRQRHTAIRVFVRLRDERGCGGSYSTVQRYAKRRREEMAEERDARDARGYLQLSWLPGECQVDFREADFRVRGVVTRGRYLTVSFPHSNVGLAQVFWGETSECVCQGLRNVFEFVAGQALLRASGVSGDIPHVCVLGDGIPADPQLAGDPRPRHPVSVHPPDILLFVWGHGHLPFLPGAALGKVGAPGEHRPGRVPDAPGHGQNLTRLLNFP